MKIPKILLAVLFCFGWQAAGFAQSSVSLVQTLPAGQTLFSDTVGYKFTVGSKPLKVSALGVARGNGLNSANQVGLWDEAGQLIASATIPLNATLENGFLWQNLTAPVTLTSSKSYTIAACGSNSLSEYRYNGYAELSSDVSIDGFVRNNQLGVFSYPSNILLNGQGAVGANLKYTVQNEPLDSDGDGVNDYRELKDATDPNNSASFNPLSKGLVAYYPFNGNANDESGTGRHANPSNAALSADRFGVPNKAYDFNGIDSKIVASTNGWPSGNSNRTVSIWLNARAMHGNLFSFGGAEVNKRFSILLGWGGSQATAFVPWGDNANFTSGNFAGAGWKHLTITWNNGTGAIYINGAKQTEFVRTINTDGSKPLVIGANVLDRNDELFSGQLDDIRIYNRALSAAEVSQLYTKESENPNMVAVQGGTLPQGSGLAGQKVDTFQIGRYEVTWGEWNTVRDWAVSNGYTDLANIGQGSADNHPVRNVSWYDVVKWCNAKSEMEGLKPVYQFGGATYKIGQSTPSVDDTADGYRLPMEKEWEWAARGGTNSQGYIYSGSNDVNAVAWYDGNSLNSPVLIENGRGTWPIAQKAANELGLFDMSGNVFEWCWDIDQLHNRYLRGGGWHYYGQNACRVVDRSIARTQNTSDTYLGFRLARNAKTNMVTVQGGTLPQGSQLAGQTVGTFQISKFETTWGEWKAVRNWAVSNGYTDLANVGAGSGDNHPVRNVSWYDVVKWCNAKSQMEGLVPVYQFGGAIYKTGQSTPSVDNTANGYRLPMKKEWEWAARGGTSSQDYTYSGSNNINEVAWTETNSMNASVSLAQGRGTWPVGQKAPNELGIFDMSGNVWEWLWDAYGGFERQITGGSWNHSAARALFSDSDGDPADFRATAHGFRLARNAIGDMVTVQGGTLPQGSGLAGQTVGTFQIGKYEVTWGEWKTVRDWAVANGYSDLANVGSGSGDDHPVRNVSWYDVVAWCNAKSKMDGFTPVYQTWIDGQPFGDFRGLSFHKNYGEYRWGLSPYPNNNGYRLPSEQEWEWAARGGLKSQGHTYSGSNDINAVAWYDGNANSGNIGNIGTRPVGQKTANELGIFDMSGNVAEWCSNGGFTYGGFNSQRVGGGNWITPSDGCAVFYRNEGDVNQRIEFNGFRLARNSGAPADTTAPVIAISSPSSGARLTSANATFGGTITETGSKPTLQYRLGTTGNWTASSVGGSASPYSFSQVVALKPGPNTVQFQAKDDAGNTSALASINVSYVVASTLTIPAPNAADGSVTSGFGGSTSREVGVSYTVTATPASGMVFKEWLKNGVSTSTNATLSFTMEPGLTLTPVFVPDFAALGGFYNGLVGVGAIGSGSAADMQAFAANNGFIQITSGANGALSGVLKIEGKSHSFTGTMGSNKRATITVPRPGKSNATLSLSLLSALPGEISGNVTTSGAPLAFRALRGGYTAGVAKHALAGKRYAIVLPPPSGLAMGYGHATLTVEDDGAAVLSGVLANGQAVNTGARIVDDGAGNWVFPVYVGGSGIFTGEIVIPKTTPASGSELGGSLEWLKPASNTGLFKSGFLKSLQPLGATHSATSAGLGGAAFSLTLDPAKRILPAAVVQTGTWGNSGSPSLTTPIKSGLTLSFNPLSGKVEGSFTRTVNGAPLPTPIQGTLFSRPISIPSGATLRGAGFFTSGNASTAVEVTTL